MIAPSASAAAQTRATRMSGTKAADNDASDATYYAQLAEGADYLADISTDPREEGQHRKMARVYRDRSRDSAPEILAVTEH